MPAVSISNSMRSMVKYLETSLPGVTLHMMTLTKDDLTSEKFKQGGINITFLDTAPFSSDGDYRVRSTFCVIYVITQNDMETLTMVELLQTPLETGVAPLYDFTAENPTGVAVPGGTITWDPVESLDFGNLDSEYYAVWRTQFEIRYIKL